MRGKTVLWAVALVLCGVLLRDAFRWGQRAPEARAPQLPERSVAPPVTQAPSESLPTTAQAGFRAAVTAYKEGDLPQAQAQLEALVRAYPKQAALYHLLGKIRYDTGDNAGAVRIIERGLQHAPNHAALTKLLKSARGEAALSKGVSLFFDFYYDGNKRLDLHAEYVPLAHMLDAAYSHLGRELRYFPKDRVQVVLYDVTDFASSIRPDAWVGGLYDGKIRVPVGNFAHEQARLQRVLTHEYTHAVVHRIAPACPTWLNEGLAQIMEGADREAADKRLRAGGHLPFEQLSQSFKGLTPQQARQAYDMSLSMTALLIERHSIFHVLDYLKDIGQDPTKVRPAFKTRFYQEPRAFSVAWQNEVLGIE
jgi:tetratricopeptide (TPR) repeat protein